MKNLLTRSLLFATVISLSSCDSAIIEENKSAEQMRKSTKIPFSAACHSIFYYMRAGGMQDLSRAVKFSCNKDKVNEVLADIIKWNDDLLGEKYQRKVLVCAPFQLDRLPAAELEKLKWWDIKNAKIERAVITSGGFACSFWITQAQGNDVTVYLFQNS